MDPLPTPYRHPNPLGLHALQHINVTEVKVTRTNTISVTYAIFPLRLCLPFGRHPCTAFIGTVTTPTAVATLRCTLDAVSQQNRRGDFGNLSMRELYVIVECRPFNQLAADRPLCVSLVF